MKLRSNPLLHALPLSLLSGAAAWAQVPTALHESQLSPTWIGTGPDAALLGDVNGDGRADYVARHGTITHVLSGADGSTIHVLAAGGALFGPELAAAGDVDGDGIEDVVVTEALPYPQTVRVFSGQTGAALLSVPGPLNANIYGHAVAGVGDVNGDGKGDFVIGSPDEPTFGSLAGKAEVRSGANGALLMTFPGAPFEEFGNAVDGAGDVNGDGVNDVIVGGAPTVGTSPDGRVRVYSGADGAVLHSFTANGSFGRSVAGIGDVDGDGKDDVAIGRPRFGPNFRGQVQVRSGATGAILLTVAGEAQDYLGTAVSSAGDFDGDGTPDVLVGAGRTSLITHTIIGYVQVRSGADGAVLAHVEGASIGFEVDGGRDVDGDGLPDFVVTEWPAGQIPITKAYSGAVFQTAPYPGTGEDLVLRTGVDGGLDGYPVKFADAGDWLRVELTSPNGTFDPYHYLVAAQLLPTAGGVPTDPGMNEVHFDLLSGAPLILIHYSIQSLFGQPGLPPGGFDDFVGKVPAGMAGVSVVVQGFSFAGGSAGNGVMAVTEAHEVRLK